MVMGRGQWRLGRRIAIIVGLVCASAGVLCAAQQKKPAVTAGGVEITSPEAGAKIRGVATVRASRPDPNGYVIFRADDTFLFASTSPYMMRWDTSNLADGDHVVNADAYSSDGEYEGSSSVQVTVQNIIPTPDNGVLLSVRLGSEEIQHRIVNARGELSALGAEEVLPTGYEALAGTLNGSLTQAVMDPFYQGTSVLVRNRLKDGALTVRNVRSSLPEVGQYAMVRVSRNGLVVPSLTAVRKTRLPMGEISLALPDYPVYPGDTWQAPLGAVVDLYGRRAVYVQGQHTFEGLRWYNGRECALVTSTYTVPTFTLYEVGKSQAGLSGTASFSMALTQMRGGRGGRGGMGGGGGARRAAGGGGRAAGTGGAGGARGRAGAAATRAGTQQGSRTGGQAQGTLQSVKLVDLQGTRVTYLTRQTGRVLQTVDTIRGRVEFRTASTVSTAQAPEAEYSVALTQMRGGRGGRGGMGGGGGARRAGGGRAAAGTGGRVGGAAARTGAQQGGRAGAHTRAAGQQQAGPTRYPAMLDYGFRLSTELVVK